MTIESIVEIQNKNIKVMPPIREKQDIYIPDIIDENISRRNGMITAYIGSGGSGKTNLLLNQFKNKNMYKNKFHNIYYFCPEASFLSVQSHPFQNHNKVYHEINSGILETIYNELINIKEEYEQEIKEPEYKEPPEIQYSVIIFDDFADSLKDLAIVRQLNKMVIKARHLCTGFIFTLQGYYYLDKMIRKQFTYISLFKTKNKEEFEAISRELINLKKDDALTLFNYVFNEDYAHLDIDTVKGRIYKNFNLLELKE